MRIAFSTLEYPRVDDGSNKYATYLTRGLAELGHDITVFAAQTYDSAVSFDGAKNLNVINVKVNENYPRMPQYSFLLPRYIRKAEKNEEFDIIHFNGFYYWFFPKRISPSPHVVTCHHLATDAIDSMPEPLTDRIIHYSRETSVFMPFIEKRVIRSADYIITVSDFTKGRVIDKYQTPASRIETIYHGIEKFNFDFTDDDIRIFKQTLGLKEETPVLLFVGNVNDPRKGLDLLLQALKLVAQQTSAILLVVGPYDQTEARNRSASLGISEKVYFLGSLDAITLQKCYATCDVFVYPSRLEGFGLPLLEAAAAAKPIVTTNVGAIPELIKRGISARVVEPNERSIAQAIIDELEDGKGSANKIRNPALDCFKWDTAALLTSALYAKLLSSFSQT